MIKKRKFIIIVLGIIILCAFVAVPVYLTKAQTLTVLSVPGGAPYRILQGESGSYWVVNRQYGLILLDQSLGGIWTYSLYNIGRVFDATGPDSNGLLYCSFIGLDPGSPCGVYVFDCASRSCCGHYSS